MFDKRLLALVPEVRKFVVLSVLFQWIALAANIALMIAIGVFLQQMLEGVAAAEGLIGLLVLGLIAIGVRIFCQISAQRMGLRASTAAKRVIRHKVYGKLLRLGPSYSEHIPTNEAVQISTEGVEQLEVYFGSYLPQLLYAVLAPLTLFVCLAPLSPLVAGILIVCVPLIPLSIVAVQRIARRVMRDYWGHYTDLGGTFLENVQGLTTLKIYQADEAQHQRMNEAAETFRQATMRLLRMQLNSITVMDLLAFGGAALGIVVTLLQFADGSLSFAGAFTIVFLSAEFFIPMRSLGSLFHTAMNGMAAAEKMFALLDVEEAAAGTASVDPADCALSCKDLRYSYDGARWALDGVSLQAPQRGLVAVVGESGSGKSTLAGVLSGRNAGYEGSVCLGKHDARDIAPESLAAAVTTVSFSSWLFKGSVRDNLLMGNPHATDEQLWGALERCRLAAFVRETGGLDAPVSEGAANLSGGQRQRLAIARALLHDSPLYVFDEATSNIDAESERAIVAVMHELARDRVVVAISHRLAAVCDAAQIYVMADGKVAESGTHEDLLARSGAYAHMWERQQELEAFAVQGDEGAESTADSDAAGVGAVYVGATAPVVMDATANATVGVVAMPDSSSGEALTAEKRAVLSAKNAGEVCPSCAVASDAPQRSAFSVMARLVTLVSPLMPFMVLAVILGVVGFGAAIFLTVFGAAGLVLLFDLVMISCAYSLVDFGQIGFGAAVLSVMALMSSFDPVIAVAALGTTLQQTIASGSRVLDILDEQPQCPEVVDGEDVVYQGAASRDVSFSYGGEDILRNVSVDFRPGVVVGISGRSGSGKSTLLKLLMRFWDPASGVVEMSGTDLRRVNTASLRMAQGYMTQDTHLFDGTIAQNILLARPDATPDQLEQACRKAALWDFVQSLPRGLDTPVGELGGALSGGERQRVGLARMFLHDAPFVLLDEPTSNLDALNEAAVLKSLSDFRANKTIVLVSHRASTCAFADVTYSVERGRLS